MDADEKSHPSGKVIDSPGKAWEAMGRAAWLARGLGRRGRLMDLKRESRSEVQPLRARTPPSQAKGPQTGS